MRSKELSFSKSKLGENNIHQFSQDFLKQRTCTSVLYFPPSERHSLFETRHGKNIIRVYAYTSGHAA